MFVCFILRRGKFQVRRIHGSQENKCREQNTNKEPAGSIAASVRRGKRRRRSTFFQKTLCFRGAAYSGKKRGFCLFCEDFFRKGSFFERASAV